MDCGLNKYHFKIVTKQKVYKGDWITTTIDYVALGNDRLKICDIK